VTALAALALCRLAASPVQLRVVNFPNSTGSSVLRMARISAGPWFEAVGYYQPTSLSYRVSTTFGLATTGGGDLTCQARVEGWARPRALTGTPIRLLCSCEQPRLHNRVPISCWEAARRATPP
jgi:hypothetical protein